MDNRYILMGEDDPDDRHLTKLILQEIGHPVPITFLTQSNEVLPYLAANEPPAINPGRLQQQSGQRGRGIKKHKSRPGLPAFTGDHPERFGRTRIGNRVLPPRGQFVCHQALYGRGYSQKDRALFYLLAGSGRSKLATASLLPHKVCGVWLPCHIFPGLRLHYSVTEPIPGRRINRPVCSTSLY